MSLAVVRHASARAWLVDKQFCLFRECSISKSISPPRTFISRNMLRADFARASLVDASIRYNELLRKSRSKPILSYEFFHANCFEVRLHWESCLVAILFVSNHDPRKRAAQLLSAFASHRWLRSPLPPFFPPQADIPAALPSTTRFDFAQCQFALHYAFDSEAHVRRALENVTARLNSGGYFVGTTTDSRTIMCVLRNARIILFSSQVWRN